MAFQATQVDENSSSTIYLSYAIIIPKSHYKKSLLLYTPTEYPPCLEIVGFVKPQIPSFQATRFSAFDWRGSLSAGKRFQKINGGEHGRGCEECMVFLRFLFRVLNEKVKLDYRCKVGKKKNS